MPHAEQGMVVGLFGGSFNPPHEGHVLVADIALRRLRLDQLWWMVTPGNPLKDHRHLAPLEERLRLSEAITPDPRIKVTAFERTIGQSYTARTLEVRPGAQSRRPLRLDHGRRQPAEFPPLAALAEDRPTLSRSRSSTGRGRRSPICRRKWRGPSTLPASTRTMPARSPSARRRPGPSSMAPARRSVPARCGTAASSENEAGST